LAVMIHVLVVLAKNTKSAALNNSICKIRLV